MGEGGEEGPGDVVKVVVVVVLATDWMDVKEVIEFERGRLRDDVDSVGMGAML